MYISIKIQIIDLDHRFRFRIRQHVARRGSGGGHAQGNTTLLHGRGTAEPISRGGGRAGAQQVSWCYQRTQRAQDIQRLHHSALLGSSSQEPGRRARQELMNSQWSVTLLRILSTLLGRDFEISARPRDWVQACEIPRYTSWAIFLC